MIVCDCVGVGVWICTREDDSLVGVGVCVMVSVGPSIGGVGEFCISVGAGIGVWVGVCVGAGVAVGPLSPLDNAGIPLQTTAVVPSPTSAPYIVQYIFVNG